MFLLVLIVVLVVVILVLKMKANDDSVKTDGIEFDTQKSVDQITSVIRSINCQVERLNDNPLDSGPRPALAVLLVGQPGFTDKFKHAGGATSLWGVQVIVTDLGNRRHVELIALGQNLMGNTTYNKGYGMGFSRDYRDKIAAMLA